MALFSLSTIFGPKVVRKAAEKAEELFNEAKAKSDTAHAPEEAAAASFVPPPVFRSASDMRRTFIAAGHQMEGFQDGHLINSHETYQDTIGSKIEEHKQICDFEIEEKKDEIYETEIELYRTGPNTEIETMYKRKLAKLNLELEALEAERAKDHLNDPTSKCQPAIKAYRKGHNEGVQKRFLTNGSKS
jgi:hypothetical protein